jgi:hypothetical protein
MVSGRYHGSLQTHTEVPTRQQLHRAESDNTNLTSLTDPPAETYYLQTANRPLLVAD